jgi:hypothetical protein
MYKYVVEMDSGAMIYIPYFIKIGTEILKLIWGWGGCRHTNTNTHTQHGDRISLFSFFPPK